MICFTGEVLRGDRIANTVYDVSMRAHYIFQVLYYFQAPFLFFTLRMAPPLLRLTACLISTCIPTGWEALYPVRIHNQTSILVYQVWVAGARWKLLSCNHYFWLRTWIGVGFLWFKWHKVFSSIIVWFFGKKLYLNISVQAWISIILLVLWVASIYFWLATK